MTDIQTGWNRTFGGADWVFLPGNDAADPTNQISYGNDLATAVMISLFTDAQANPDDVIPDGTTNPRGWWGGPIGSRIWIYVTRGKATADVPGNVQQAASDALQWMLNDGVATSIDVAAAYTAPGKLRLRVKIVCPGGSALVMDYPDLGGSAGAWTVNANAAQLLFGDAGGATEQLVTDSGMGLAI